MFSNVGGYNVVAVTWARRWRVSLGDNTIISNVSIPFCYLITISRTIQVIKISANRDYKNIS